MFDLKNEKASPGLEGFADEFLNDRLAELSIMKKYIETSELEPIGKLAHKWKGFCTPYGFNFLEVLSESLEKTAGELNIDGCTTILNQISEYLVAKEKILKTTES